MSEYLEVDGHRVVLQRTYYKSGDQFYETFIPGEMLDKAYAELAELRAQVEGLTAEIDLYKQANRIIKDENSMLLAQVEGFMVERDHYREQNTALRASADRQSVYTDQVVGENQAIREANIRLKAENDKLRATIERLREWCENHAWTETNWENRLVLAVDVLKLLDNTAESEA